MFSRALICVAVLFSCMSAESAFGQFVPEARFADLTKKRDDANQIVKRIESSIVKAGVKSPKYPPSIDGKKLVYGSEETKKSQLQRAKQEAAEAEESLAEARAAEAAKKKPGRPTDELVNPLKLKMIGKIPGQAVDGHRYVKAGKIVDAKAFTATITWYIPSGIATVPASEVRSIVVVKGVNTEGVATDERVILDQIFKVTGTMEVKSPIGSATRFVIEPYSGPIEPQQPQPKVEPFVPKSSK